MITKCELEKLFNVVSIVEQSENYQKFTAYGGDTDNYWIELGRGDQWFDERENIASEGIDPMTNRDNIDRIRDYIENYGDDIILELFINDNLKAVISAYDINSFNDIISEIRNHVLSVIDDLETIFDDLNCLDCLQCDNYENIWKKLQE